MKNDIDLTSERFEKLFDPNNPDNQAWMQREDENNLWYGRFMDYLLQGKSRSVNQAVNKWRREKGKKESNSISSSWINAKKRHEWGARAEAFDNAADEIRKGLWASRQADIIERDWKMAGALYEKLEKMLEYPLEKVTHKEKKDKNGQVIEEVTNIYPANWNMNSVVRLADQISDLGRSAVGLPTEHTLADVEDSQVVVYLPANQREKDVEVKEEIKENGSKEK